MAGTVRIVQGGLKAGSDATLEAYNEVSGHIKGVDASKEAARAGWQGQGSDAMYAAAMLWIEKATVQRRTQGVRGQLGAGRSDSFCGLPEPREANDRRRRSLNCERVFRQRKA